MARAGDGVSLRGAPQLLSIQILRAVAALAVLTHHTLFEISFYISGRGVQQKVLVGAAGVDLFFVISGFVMVYSSESLFGRPHAPRTFFLRRLARVAPLYWAVSATLLAYVLIAHHGLVESQTIGSVIASFAFVPFPSPDRRGLIPPIHGLGWTLNYEMFFYMVFSAAILLPRRLAVAAMTLAFLVLAAVGRTSALPQPFAFWCDPIILEFCLGMAVALCLRAEVRLPPAAAYGLGIAAITALAASVSWEPTGPVTRFLQWGVPCAALVAACVLSREASRQGPLARAFGFLGDASYSLYLVHPFVISAARKTVARWIDFSILPWAYAPIIFLGAIAAAIVSYLFFEKPVTRILQARQRKPLATTAP